MLVEQKKCDNCGGTLVFVGNDRWQCIYCKTIYIESQPLQTSTNVKTISVQQVYKYIEELKKRAAEKENDNIVLRSGDIHKELGLTSRMPTVCAAMRKAMRDGDAILHQTPSGNSSTLLIKYSIK